MIHPTSPHEGHLHAIGRGEGALHACRDEAQLPLTATSAPERGRPVPWCQAMEQALYGPEGLYRRPEGPAAHYRTAPHVSPLFAEAVHRLATAAGLRTVVDVGAGRGELLTSLYELAPQWRLIAVEVAERPATLPDRIEWMPRMPIGLTALVIANEWLDNVPLDIVTITADGPRLVLVDPVTGDEEPGPRPCAKDLDWLSTWWPLHHADIGDRAEIGYPRDEAWATVVSALGGGVALAIDYGHLREARPRMGSLAGYRRGRLVAAVPDGSCDITAHVAMDSCATAGTSAGAAASRLQTQRDALTTLGISGIRPPHDMARADPRGYLRSLSAATQAAELTDASGLGAFLWLLQELG
jgi:SAM-dependent MidA family methyltransferase